MRLIPYKKQQNSNLSSWLLFDDFFNKFFHDDYIENTRLMAVDVIENKDNFIVKANIPGIEKKDINISIKENKLIIEASHEMKNAQNGESMIRCERYLGKYQRIISLPDSTACDKIKAKLENGVLELLIPKKEPAPMKNIVIE